MIEILSHLKAFLMTQSAQTLSDQSCFLYFIGLTEVQKLFGLYKNE